MRNKGAFYDMLYESPDSNDEDNAEVLPGSGVAGKSYRSSSIHPRQKPRIGRRKQQQQNKQQRWTSFTLPTGARVNGIASGGKGGIKYETVPLPTHKRNQRRWNSNYKCPSCHRELILPRRRNNGNKKATRAVLKDMANLRVPADPLQTKSPTEGKEAPPTGDDPEGKRPSKRRKVDESIYVIIPDDGSQEKAAKEQARFLGGDEEDIDLDEPPTASPPKIIVKIKKASTGEVGRAEPQSMKRAPEEVHNKPDDSSTESPSEGSVGSGAKVTVKSTVEVAVKHSKSGAEGSLETEEEGRPTAESQQPRHHETSKHKSGSKVRITVSTSPPRLEKPPRPHEKPSVGHPQQSLQTSKATARANQSPQNFKPKRILARPEASPGSSLRGSSPSDVGWLDVRAKEKIENSSNKPLRTVEDYIKALRRADMLAGTHTYLGEITGNIKKNKEVDKKVEEVGDDTELDQLIEDTRCGDNMDWEMYEHHCGDPFEEVDAPAHQSENAGADRDIGSKHAKDTSSTEQSSERKTDQTKINLGKSKINLDNAKVDISGVKFDLSGLKFKANNVGPDVRQIKTSGDLKMSGELTISGELQVSGAVKNFSSSPALSPPVKDPRTSWQSKFTCSQAHPLGARSSNPNRATVEKLLELAKWSEILNDEWPLKTYRRAASTLRKQKTLISTKQEALKLPNIGVRIAPKIEEFVRTKRIRRLEELEQNPINIAIRKFVKIYGVGPRDAGVWARKGYRSIADVLQSETNLTRAQHIGIQHYDDFNTRIPREVVAEHFSFVQEVAKEISPALDVEVMGSYRRGAPDCGDIDFMITADLPFSDLGILVMDKLIRALSERGYLQCELVSSRDWKSGKQAKWHGAARLPGENVWRRVDILVVDRTERGAARLYFTGNDLFNRSMRLLAQKKGMSLSEHGLFKGVVRDLSGNKTARGELVEAEDERKIFEALGIAFRLPRDRNP